MARALLPVAFLAFAALGLPDGILGVSWPAMRARFGAPLDALGLLLAVSTAGYVLSSFGTAWLLARLGLGGVLAGSTVLAALGLGAYAAAPGFAYLLAAALAAGLGGGAVDAGLNAFAALRFSPRILNWLHASYGFGALSGPLLMTALVAGGASWRAGYAVVALIQGVLGTVFLATSRAWGTGRAGEGAPAAGDPSHAGYGEALADGRVWLGIAAFFLYAGLEFAVGQWAYSLLTLGRGLAPARAGLWVGLFYGGFFLGRVAAGSLRFGDNPGLIVRVAPAGLLAGSLLARFGGAGTFTALGLAVLGLACAPIYPALVAATPRRLGPRLAAHAMGMQVAAATIGIALIPGLIGIVARRAGAEAISPAWVAAAVLTGIALQGAARDVPRGAEAADPAG